MTEAHVWLDGELVPASAAKVTVADRGFTSGDGVFETLKVVDGQPFACDRHLERLRNSARIVGLPLPAMLDFRRIVADTIAANAGRIGDVGRLRITITAGPAIPGVTRSSVVPTVVVTCDPQSPHPDSLVVVTVPWPLNEHAPTVGAKTTSYADNLVILERVRKAGADEALMPNTAGNLCEATTANVFLVLDGQLVTPSLASGCLAGVTRQLILEWGIAIERDVPFTAVRGASEVLLSSSTRDLLPVSRLDGRHLAAPGPVGGDAIERFRRQAGANLNP